MINTWADMHNRAGLAMEVMDECNAPNFPLDRAAAVVIAGALKAPAIGRVMGSRIATFLKCGGLPLSRWGAIQVGWQIQGAWLCGC